MNEFQEVGKAVQDLAADDATVVVGTVIDADLQDELRVTLVATGLGATARAVDTPVQVVRNATTGEVDYSELSERPAIRRKEAAEGAAAEAQGDAYLDIPAFLRRQAD